MTTIRYIDTTDLPKGFDVGDLLAAGTKGDDLIAWCKARVRQGNVPPESPPAAVAVAEPVDDDELAQRRQKKTPAAGGQPGSGGGRTGEVVAEKEPATPRPSVSTVTDGNVVAIDVRPSQIPPEPDEIMLPPEYSDDALARAFTHEHAGEFLYVPAWSRWMAWDGARWSHDDRMQVQHAARLVLREQANDIMMRQHEFKSKARAMATAVTSARAIQAVLNIARTHPSQSSSPAQFDQESWILNTPGGVVDLRTGDMRPASPRDYCSKVTRVAPGGECPTWMRFLHDATAGDVDLQSYLQRVVGYCLTGSTEEQALFFFYGTGQNGKGTFLNFIQWMVGDYTRVADMATFIESKSDRHTTELAELQGARMVTSQETDEGKRWAESRIKSMTGSDPITARFMRQDNFTYIPQFKLMIAGNHKPGIKSIDPAIRRRINLIPFTVTIPASKRDNNLMAKLRAEAGGIMAWAVQGCLDWQRIGLTPPDRVVKATDEYFASQDTIGQWIEDECVDEGNTRVLLHVAYRSYQKYAQRQGAYIMEMKRWLDNMELKGYRAEKRPGSDRVLVGLRMRREIDSAQDDMDML